MYLTLAVFSGEGNLVLDHGYCLATEGRLDFYERCTLGLVWGRWKCVLERCGCTRRKVREGGREGEGGKWEREGWREGGICRVVTCCFDIENRPSDDLLLNMGRGEGLANGV